MRLCSSCDRGASLILVSNARVRGAQLQGPGPLHPHHGLRRPHDCDRGCMCRCHRYVPFMPPDYADARVASFSHCTTRLWQLELNDLQSSGVKSCLGCLSVHRRRCVHEDEKDENVRAWDGGGILGACTRFAPILSRVAAGAEPAGVCREDCTDISFHPLTHAPLGARVCMAT